MVQQYKEKRDIKLWMDIGDQEKELKDQMTKVGKAMFECGYKHIDDILLFYYGHTQVEKDGYVTTFE